ncbi:hypothetical protein [Sebaldella termitidis]|uniref:hypothetical protein n=1 Tax=Sebaldella termitidis TaxID=826 RepID=UPI003EBC7E6E
MKKLSNMRIAFLVETETLEGAMHEKVSSKDIEDPELAELWRKAAALFDELKPIRAEIFKILRAAESED